MDMTQWEREQEMAYTYRSMEDKAAFDAQYVNRPIVLPEAGAISLEQAEALARGDENTPQHTGRAARRLEEHRSEREGKRLTQEGRARPVAIR